MALDHSPEELAADFSMLLQYRDLGPGRSGSQAAVVSGLSQSTLRRMVKCWEWKTLLDAYSPASWQASQWLALRRSKLVIAPSSGISGCSTPGCSAAEDDVG